MININDLISRITYKPGYSFKAVPLEFADGVSIIVRGEEVDVDNPDRTVRVYNQVSLSAEELVDEEYTMLRIQHLCYRASSHEVDEWLRVDGKPVKDPHPENSLLA